MNNPTQFFNRIKERLESMVLSPGRELGRWAHFIRYQMQLWPFCARRLRENNSMAMSAALSFRTIFALVPVLVLTLMVVKMMVSQEDSRSFIRSCLAKAGINEQFAMRVEDNVAGDSLNSSTLIPQDPGRADPGTTAVPATGVAPAPAGVSIQPAEPEMVKMINVVDEIMKVVDRVDQKLTFQKIGPIGVALLIWTAITLITTVERSLNRIYRASQSRALVRRVLLYWSVLTLVPIVMVVTIYLESSLIEAIKHIKIFNITLTVASLIGPVIIGILVVTALYKLLPNTHVSFKAALGGAMVAYPVWLVAQWLFTQYIVFFVSKGSLYGTLGLLPVFLMWLNLSWTIFLFGAELSHTAANLKKMQSAEKAARIHLTPMDSLAAALIVARPYQAGDGAVRFETVSNHLDMPYESVQNLITRLIDNRVICPVGSGDAINSYVLARPAEKIPIADILEMNKGAIDQTGQDSNTHLKQFIKKVFEKVDGVLKNYTLANLLDEGDKK